MVSVFDRLEAMEDKVESVLSKKFLIDSPLRHMRISTKQADRPIKNV